MTVWAYLSIGSALGLVLGLGLIACTHRLAWGHWRFWVNQRVRSFTGCAVCDRMGRTPPEHGQEPTGG